jgi:ELWxxDGT repeat protein
MKNKYLLIAAVIIMFTALKTVAQNAMNIKSAEKTAISFGKKLPPPSLTIRPGNSLQGKVRPGMPNLSMQRIKDLNANDIKKDPARFKQQALQMRGNRYAPALQTTSATATDFTTADEDNSHFHITKDINALAESYPSNYSSNFYPDYSRSYAVLNNVIYFAANDAIHGIELWRSDGTDAGTYMLKDIVRGAASSDILDITAANGKLYFAAFTPDNGYEPWVSDGTESGTQLLMDISPGTGSSYPLEFVALHDRVYFAAGSAQDELWKTDGTTSGTKEVIDIGQGGSTGYAITQLTTANNLLFFTFADFTTGGWQLWRSNGTANATYDVSRGNFFPYVPAQLTKYNNELYFSADDGTGRKLWISDGTDVHKAANQHGVLVYADYFGIKFPVLNNVLYIPGINAAFTTGALYKYDASNSDGMVKVKGLVSDPVADYVVASEMQVVHNMLYFKVTSFIGGLHDELWSSNGEKASTQAIYRFAAGEAIANLYDETGTLYFEKYDKIFGAELWKLVNTFFGSFPFLVNDNFRGATSSYPSFFTAFKDRLFYSATSGTKGNELFMTNGISIGATVVKDINTTSTSNSYAGYYYGPGSITAVKDAVIFNAYENVHGVELYKSGGTAAGTILLNDIFPGERSSGPYNFLSKNNNAYFVADVNDSAFAIYKTNVTKSGLQKITPDYVYYYYFLQDFKVANNGVVFYVLFSFNTFQYELWCSDGTSSGTFMLSSSVYDADYLNVVGNNAFFVAGDNAHGYELWKSNGSIAGTKIVKDINHGTDGSYPGGMFVFNNEVYFGANDGSTSNGGSGAGFWKSDGTDAGTVKLKDIDPWWGGDVAGTDLYYFEAANNELYFAAINYANAQGTKLWKTDGTPHGTVAVKDITPDANSYYPVPIYFTNVNGTVYFIGDDDVYGTELWKTDGTEHGTQLVKDITPGANGSSLTNLVSYAGKLYFTNNGILWSSDGTEHGTQPVNGAFLSNINIYNVIPAGNKLFISGNTLQYGVELYEGEINDDGKFIASSVTNSAVKTTANNMLLYPNPAKNILNVNLSSINLSKATLQVTSVAGNILITKEIDALNKQNVLQLNISQLAAGTYLIKITSANGTVMAKPFVKE